MFYGEPRGTWKDYERTWRLDGIHRGADLFSVPVRTAFGAWIYLVHVRAVAGRADRRGGPRRHYAASGAGFAFLRAGLLLGLHGAWRLGLRRRAAARSLHAGPFETRWRRHRSLRLAHD